MIVRKCSKCFYPCSQRKAVFRMNTVVDHVNAIVWSSALVFLCLAAGLFYTIVTRAVQIRFFRRMWSILFDGKASSRGISSFQALTVSLSGRVGTGNIAGVATAIGLGGPGAVFWMWIMGILGAATSFIECTLGQLYKEEINGEYRGGPAFYLEGALGSRLLGVLFAVATIIATALLLPTIQSNSIGAAVTLALDMNGSAAESALWVIAAIIALLLAATIFGGIKRIAFVTNIVVPFMALVYIAIALLILFSNIHKVPAMFGLILGDAFNPMAGMGAAIGWGVRRGIYSNEAGQGTGPHAAAAAEVSHPAEQGLVQSLSVYIDTLFICTATAFIILLTDSYNVLGADGGFLVQYLPADISPNTPAFTQTGISTVFPQSGEWFIASALFFFAFTTVLAYYYIAETNLAYLLDRLKIAKSGGTPAKFILKLIIIAAAIYGTVNVASLAWGLGDLGVGIMAWLNIVGIILIYFSRKPALRTLAHYEKHLAQSGEVVGNDLIGEQGSIKREGKTAFTAQVLGIKNPRNYWNG